MLPALLCLCLCAAAAAGSPGRYRLAGLFPVHVPPLGPARPLLRGCDP